MNPKDFADSVFGKEDEKKGTCIHCGKETYEKWLEDGVCEECLEKGLPGRLSLSKDKKIMNIMLVAMVLLLIVFLFFVMTIFVFSEVIRLV